MKNVAATINVATGLFLALVLASLLPPFPSDAANFEVAPVRFLFSGSKGSDILQIKNESDGNLQVQIRAYEWRQDAEGKDVYSDTKDVIFFPRIVSLKQGEARIVRVGTKTPPGKQEKTYRMYIEEMPGKETLQGTTLRTLLRIGIPVFLSPVTAEARGTLAGLKAEAGRKVSFVIKNQGNVHFMIRSIKMTGHSTDGSELFADESQGWYLHAGAAKAITREVPKDVCPKINRIRVEVSTDKPTLNGALDVQQGICAP
ncbi:MAG: molecular chaperone [Deltaproteobacteria bacterium]|nr:molecular chaperone [Deltaproteobacteria bacterium]